MPNQDESATDIGTLLEVPEDQRQEVDPAPEYNADAGFDVNVVPDGEYFDLDTAWDDDESDDVTGEDDIEGDGTPEQFISPNDPDYARLCEED